MKKIKALKMNKKGESVKDKDGNFIFEEIDIEKIVSEEAKKLAKEITDNEKKEAEEVTKKAADENKIVNKKEFTAEDMKATLDSLVQAFKGNSNLSADLENNESDKQKVVNNESVSSSGIDLQTKKIVGLEKENG